MYSFRELQKACKKEAGGKEIRLAVLGNCATQFFSQAVKGYGRLSGLNLTVFDADYNQIATQLLNPSSEVYGFGADKILIWLCTEKIYEEYLAEEVSLRNAFAETYMQKIQHYWDLIEKNSKAQILQINFCEIDDKAMGNYSCKMDFTFIYQIRKLNYLLAEAEAKNGKIYPVDALSLQLNLGRDFFFDAALYYHAKMSVSMDALPYLAKAVIDVVNAMNGKIKKCVILDLDNTLWGGIIGDDGMGGIEIGEYGKGHVFTNLQRWIKQLKDCGIILAVCSKNEADIAREPFEKHEEMILRLSDISIFVANWNDKASNIKMIQESLNIGMDSMVFLDDNPVERNLVKEKCPDIEVPELYQREFERKSHQQSFETIDDYLQNLMMEGRSKAFEPVKYPRIAQLTQRTNQFNLRTVRYTEDDIKRLAEDKGFITLYYTLKDKFGDYGLVSVVILKKTSEKELFVDTWLMSCRVFKRGMEEFVMNHVVQTAKENGFETISSQYIPTKKNQMVKDIYETMGFNRDGENLFHLDLDTFKTAKTYIKEADSDE